MELNQYQKEMEQLLALQDKKVSRELFNLYVDTIKDLKKSLLVEYQNFENLSRSKKMDLKRMDALLETLERRTEDLKDGLNGIIPQHVKRASKLAYNELFYEYEQTHTGLNFALLKEDELEVLINTPVAGFRLSERLNDGVVPDLKKGIKSELERSFLYGESYAKTAKRLSQVGAASYSRAMRIARTEAGRVSSIARQKSQLEAQSLGVEFKKVWSAVYDKRTRHNHQELDGQAVDPEGYFEIGSYKALQPKMFGVASEDINCRCRTISSFEDDDTPLLKRDNETGEIGEWKNYREWSQLRTQHQQTRPLLSVEQIKNRIDYIDMTKATPNDIIELGKQINDRFKVSEYVGNHEKLKEIFSNFRVIGGEIPKERWSKGSSVVVKNQLQKAFSYYPKEWAEIPERLDKKLKAIKRKRGYFDGHSKVLTIATNGVRETTPFHEIGHMVELVSPELVRLEKAWVDERTEGEMESRLKDIFPLAGYGPREVTKKDNFVSPYIGKYYQNAAEVFTMGLQGIFVPEESFVKSFDKKTWAYDKKTINDDPEFLNFIIGLFVKV